MKSFEYTHIAVVIYFNHAVTILSVLACHAVQVSGGTIDVH